MIVTFELEDAQGAFEIVQAKILFPKPRLVTVVFGNNEFVITPLPEINDHEPTPTAGKFPFIVADGEEIQSV